MKNRLWIILSATLASMCALVSGATQAAPEMQVVNDAARALGGRDRIETINSLILTGQGAAAHMGQGRTPAVDLDEAGMYRVTEFTQTFDLVHGRMRMQQTREATFPSPFGVLQRSDQGIDGDVAYNISPDGKASRAPLPVVSDRQLDRLQHPLARR